MKQDEKALWEMFGNKSFPTPREAARHLGIPSKRVDYLCRKWGKQNLYDWGTSVDLGWKIKGEQK